MSRELRNRLMLTGMLLALFRFGYWIHVPGIEAANGERSSWMDFAALLAASDLGSGAVFGLGIMPYISASIVVQLLGQVVPSLQALSKEGEAGRRRLNEYTRYATLVVAFLQSIFWSGVIGGGSGAVERIFAAVVMSAGTMSLTWIGEQIDAFGIGNGISLLIMGGIVSRLPVTLFGYASEALVSGIGIGKGNGIELLVGALVAGWLFVAGLVLMSESHRRIPVISAGGKANRGQYIPLKVNQAGVMPVIFAGSVLLIPAVLLEYLGSVVESGFLMWTLGAVRGSGIAGVVLQWLMISLFTYFWTAISFRPEEIAQGMKDSGVFIPGLRPGKRTESHLEFLAIRLTAVSAVALSLIATLPVLNGGVMRGVSGTGMMIIVSVVLDLRSRLKTFSG